LDGGEGGAGGGVGGGKATEKGMKVQVKIYIKWGQARSNERRKSRKQGDVFRNCTLILAGLVKSALQVIKAQRAGGAEPECRDLLYSTRPRQFRCRGSVSKGSNLPKNSKKRRTVSINHTPQKNEKKKGFQTSHEMGQEFKHLKTNLFPTSERGGKRT